MKTKKITKTFAVRTNRDKGYNDDMSVYDLKVGMGSQTNGRESGMAVDVYYSDTDSHWAKEVKGKRGMSLHNDGNNLILTTKNGSLELDGTHLDMLKLALMLLEEKEDLEILEMKLINRTKK